MAAFQDFHAKARPAIRGGDALAPAAVTITGGPDAPVVTDGPFAEGAEVACGYYVFDADDLDEALTYARDIPAAKYGAVEVWPMFGDYQPAQRDGGQWLALLQAPPEGALTPGTPEWLERAAPHQQFASVAGDHIIGGAALYEVSTASTVRVRDGEVLITDGPYAEAAEVANGFYVLSAEDRDEAVKVASMIPAATVQLRQLAGISGL